MTPIKRTARSRRLKTPGVYVEEVSIRAPQVAEVETAIPAFLGYVEKADNLFEPVPIRSILEFVDKFGGKAPLSIDEVRVDRHCAFASADTRLRSHLHDSIRLFYENGGGECYVVPVGTYPDRPGLKHFERGLDRIAREGRVTLLLFPDAVLLGMDLYSVQKLALKQCEKLQDRFAILDLPDIRQMPSPKISEFRSEIGIENLKYGAAYLPHLEFPSERSLGFRDLKGKVRRNGERLSIADLVEDREKLLELARELDRLVDITPEGPSTPEENKLETALRTLSPRYGTLLGEIERLPSAVPPSGAVAGVYAMTDATQGVWKAPANVAIGGITGVACHIVNSDQEDLNVDTVAGKSINAIRPFIGKGCLIWGARTLAGNDNDWRYVSVRRFFIMLEESLKKSTQWAVFEPNDANLWVKVKAMIENFLIRKWREGALAGSKPEHSFFVHVGLGQTMTETDILDGRLNIEVGVAPVKPAEFIILKFAHKMQEN